MKRDGIRTAAFVGAGFTVVFLALPVLGLAARAPWSDLDAVFSDPGARAALRLSLMSSFLATGSALLLGAPLAWLLATRSFTGRSLLRALALLPLVLPPVAGGIALLLVFGRSGPIGGVLESLFGLRVFGTTAAVVIAETFVAIPLVVLSLESGFRSLDPRLREVARSLGAPPRRILTMVTLPLLKPSLAAAAVLAWARALGEFGATITFAGNLPGATRTLPLEIFVQMQHDFEGAVALSLMMILVSIVVLIVLRGRWTR